MESALVQARLRTTQAAALQQAVILLKQSVEDVVFRFFPWGIQVCAIDQPNELSIIRFEIRKEAVVAEGGHYESSAGSQGGDEEVFAGVSLSELAAALGTAGGKDTLTLEVIKNRETSSDLSVPSRVLRVHLTNAAGKDSIHDINVLDMDVEDMEFPDAIAARPDSHTFVLDSTLLHDTCKNVIKRKARHMILYVSKRGDLVLQAVGTLGKVSENVPIGGDKKASMDYDDILSMAYGSKYVYHFLKQHKMSRDIEVTLTPHMPLILTFRVETLGFLRIYITPQGDLLSDAERAQHRDLILVRNQ